MLGTGVGLPLGVSFDLPWRLQLTGAWGPTAYIYRDAADGRLFQFEPEYRFGGGLRF